MEFLRKYAEAKQNGVSKDEFMSYWEASMSIERQKVEQRLLSLGGNLNGSLDKGYSGNSSALSFNADKMYEEINNLRQEVHQMFDILRSEMLSMQAQMKKQIEEECRLNLDSMKAYVQNEIELLYQSRQDLSNGDHSSPVVVDNPFKNFASNGHYEAVSNSQPVFLQNLNAEQQFHHQVRLSPPISLKDTQPIFPHNPNAPLQQQLHQRVNTSSPVPLVSNGHEPDSSLGSLAHSRYTPVVSKSYAAAAASESPASVETEQALEQRKDNTLLTESSLFNSVLDQNPIEAKGFIADIISKQMAKSGALLVHQPPRSKPKNGELVPYHGIPLGKLGKLSLSDSFRLSRRPSSSIVQLPLNGMEFKIPNCTRWDASRADFYTPHCYTIPKRCKVRLQMRFSSKGFLCVNLLLSKGAEDELIQWPVSLCGWGQIYNHGSKRFTQIWTIDPQNCFKPSGDHEFSIGAAVCLVTSRGDHHEVTLAKLREKRYEHQDSLTFRWCLTAEDELSKND